MRPISVMLFAAGFGTRMKELTAHQPKPLVHVKGRALIDYAFDQIDAADVGAVVVNLHYRGAQIETHLKGRDVAFSWEHDQILETGGGLRQALPLLGSNPVITLNTDAVWTGQNPLTQLLAAWDNDRMDALLLLSPAADALGHSGVGDFHLSSDGRISRAKGAAAPIYLGAQIIRTDRLLGRTETAFSLNLLWDEMISEGRAFGILHQGGWCDVGQPASIALAETLLGAQDV